jgi:hypothetical protein
MGECLAGRLMQNDCGPEVVKIADGAQIQYLYGICKL